MTSEPAKSRKLPTLEEMNELGNKILIRTYENIETMKNDLIFTDSQLERIQGMISKCRCSRDLKDLNGAHRILLETKYLLTERIAISYMAHVRPLTNLLNYHDAKLIEELEETPQLSGSTQSALDPEFDLSAVYKKYED